MALVGKLSTELAIKAPPAKWFNFILKQQHEFQNVAGRVHQTKLHQGDDWYHPGAVKHWTYVIDGKVTTCKENVESIDERNKTSIYNLFDGEISQNFKVFKLIFQVIEKEDGSAFVKWTIEYEKLNENVEPPYGYVEFFTKCSTDVDAHLLKA